jgi:hypothetical protein
MKGISTSMWCSKMEPNFERASLDTLMSLQEVAASGRADTVALIAKFRAQQERTKRLNEYRDDILAEIRLS